MEFFSFSHWLVRLEGCARNKLGEINFLTQNWPFPRKCTHAHAHIHMHCSHAFNDLCTLISFHSFLDKFNWSFATISISENYQKLSVKTINLRGLMKILNPKLMNVVTVKMCVRALFLDVWYGFLLI